MNNERILSMSANSMIYHKPGCRYVSRIKYKNRMQMPRDDARRAGYNVCRYCNSMNHHYRIDRHKLDFYEKNKEMQFRFIDGILYVKSQLGCWKIVYIRKAERFVLYHRNSSPRELDFEHPQYEQYHRQEDKPCCNSIEGYLNYIYEHDKYKAAIERGETVTKFSNKKYAKREARAKKKRENKRMDYLFRMIESENTGYRQLSYC